MNRRQLFAVVVLVSALVAGTWAVGRVQETTDNTYANIERFIQVLTKVRDHYVEAVTTDKLMDSAIRGMLRTLDPYSQYLDKEEAERLAVTIDLNWVRRARGEYLPLASPEEALAYPYSPADRERIRARRARLFVGTPAAVRERLAPLIAATRADELMVTTMIYDHAARRRSYELLAQAFGREPA